MTWLWWLWPLGGPAQAWSQIFPNVVATILSGAAMWFWSIRPHLNAARRHRDDLTRQLAELHQTVREREVRDE